MQLIEVQYLNKDTGEMSARAYTYYSEDTLKVGDIIAVPVKDTVTNARVSAVDVPESKIEKFKDKVKVIPAKKTEQLSLDQIPEPEPANDSFPEFLEDKPELKADDNATTALVNINPMKALSILSMAEEAIKISMLAQKMVVNDLDSERAAINDKAICKTMIEAGEAEQKKWLAPINEIVATIKADFKKVLDPLKASEETLKSKILAYRSEQIRLQKEAEAKAKKDQEDADRIAQKERELAELKHQQEVEAAIQKNEPIPAYVEPEIIKPVATYIPPVPKTINAALASSSTKMDKKWRWKPGISHAEKIAKLPAEFLMANDTLIGQRVRGKAAVTEADFGGVIELYEELNMMDRRKGGN